METTAVSTLAQLLQAIPILLYEECEELNWYMNNVLILKYKFNHS